MKKRNIREQLREIDQRLHNAEAYVARNQNIKSTFLHFKDWEGKSGHPLWMKNFMIPTTKKVLAHKEKALQRMIAKERQKQREKARRTASEPPAS